MRQRHVPLADCRCCVFVITDSYHFRHFLLQISPIERHFSIRILRDCARRVVNRVAAENKKMFDLAAAHSVGQLENGFRVPIAGKLPDDNCAPDIFERRVHSVGQQLHHDGLMLPRENDAHA